MVKEPARTEQLDTPMKKAPSLCHRIGKAGRCCEFRTTQGRNDHHPRVWVPDLQSPQATEHADQVAKTPAPHQDDELFPPHLHIPKISSQKDEVASRFVRSTEQQIDPRFF
jgi:hypothetical protein